MKGVFGKTLVGRDEEGGYLHTAPAIQVYPPYLTNRLDFRKPNPACLCPIPGAALFANDLPHLTDWELHDADRTITKSIQTFAGE